MSIEREEKYKWIKRLAQKGIGGRKEFWYHLVQDTTTGEFLVETEWDYAPHSGGAEHGYHYSSIEKSEYKKEAKKVLEEEGLIP